MLFYHNGGPGPATRLLRVDAPKDATIEQWRRAPAERWTVKTDQWRPESVAQLDILGTGDYSMCDESEVADVQRGMRSWYGTA
jgi:hypothetical protein